MTQVHEESKEKILQELRSITSNIREKYATLSNSSAKRTLAGKAQKQEDLIYRLARTTGYPEEDAVAHSKKISSWLKFAKIRGLPRQVQVAFENEEYVESWCFYLKGFDNIHGVVVAEEVDGETKILDTQFFLHSGVQ